MDEEEYVEYENIFTPQNRDYRIEELQPELSCGFCPPNRGENSNQHYRKQHRRNLKDKAVSRNKNAGRKFKRSQHQ